MDEGGGEATAATVARRRRLAERVGAERIRPLLTRSNRPGLTLLAWHLGLLIAGGVAVAAARGTWWLWPVWVVDGVVIAHLFALQHETAHGTAFVGRRLNRAITTVCGALLGVAPVYFRFEHAAHHTWTQDVERDPEMIEVPASIWAWLWFLAGGPFWGYQGRTLMSHAMGRFSPGERAFLPARAQDRVRWEAILLLIGWGALVGVPLALGSDAVVIYWLVPRVLGEPVMRLARLSEHAGRPRRADVAENTRTLDVPWPLRRLAWNMPYHAEHHAFPSVPFHALPELRTLLAGYLDGPHGGYLAAQIDILRCTRSDRDKSRRQEGDTTALPARS
jgi:fatty acid desaturase